MSTCYLRQAQREVKEHEGTGKGGDGLGMYEAAVEAALRAEAKSAGERWQVSQMSAYIEVVSTWTKLIRQPSFILADILFSRQQYILAGLHLRHAMALPSFITATPQERSLLSSFSDRIALHTQQLRQSFAEQEQGTTDVHRSKRRSSERAGPELDRSASVISKLSPDILLRVVEVGRVDDPGLPERLSGVCRRIRQILVGQPGVWQKLDIGGKPHLELRVKTYLERCDGDKGLSATGLKELRIRESYKWEDPAAIGRILAPHAGYIERLEVVAKDPVGLLFWLRGSMAHLRYLTIRCSSQEKYLSMKSLHFGLLPAGSGQLEEVDIEAVRYQGEDAPGGENISWVENPRIQLANLKVLRLQECWTFGAYDDLLVLLRSALILREVYIGAFYWHPDTEGSAETGKPRTLIRLEHLKKWSCQPDEMEDQFDHIGLFRAISAPSLTHLDLLIPDRDSAGVLQAEGLRDALPHLLELTIRHADLQADSGIPFAEALQPLSALRYLHLHDCENTGENFYRPFTANTTPPLLPNLVALAISEDPHVQAATLRSLVESRVPHADRSVQSVAGLLAIRSRRLANPDPLPFAASQQPPSSSDTSAMAGIPPPRLRWLSISDCKGVDPMDSLIYPYLELSLDYYKCSSDKPPGAGRGMWDRWMQDMA